MLSGCLSVGDRIRSPATDSTCLVTTAVTVIYQFPRHKDQDMLGVQMGKDGWLWSFLFCNQQRFLCKRNRSLCLCCKTQSWPFLHCPWWCVGCSQLWKGTPVVPRSWLCPWVPSITPAWCSTVPPASREASSAECLQVLGSVVLIRCYGYRL